jgi:uncharacterized protein YmfQ (DUF2313 family)
MDRRSTDDYLAALRGLLPRGYAWTLDRAERLSALLGAIAAGFADVDARAHDLMAEARPSTCRELLPEWEAEYGLPDPCLPPAATDAERRAAVVARKAAIGGQSAPYFLGLARDLGYDQAEIIRRRPVMCGRSACGGPDRIGTPRQRYWWTIKINEPRVGYFRMGEGRCGLTPLGAIRRAEDLVCRIEPLQPAQGRLTFDYSGA